MLLQITNDIITPMAWKGSVVDQKVHVRYVETQVGQISTKQKKTPNKQQEIMVSKHQSDSINHPKKLPCTSSNFGKFSESKFDGKPRRLTELTEISITNAVYSSFVHFSESEIPRETALTH